MQQNNAQTEEFCERLRLALGDQSIREFAGKTGISPSGLGQYLSGKSEPTRPVVVAIADAAGVEVEWLAAGKGPMRRGGQRSTAGGVIYIARLDVQASAGEGTVVGTEAPVERRPFSKTEIARYRTDPENLHIIEVRGESMQPTFNPGDEVMVDHTAFQTVVDGIYAIRVDDTLMLKRVQHLPGGQLNVTSDNPAYQPFKVSLDDSNGDFQIVGRVVWGAKRY